MSLTRFCDDCGNILELPNISTGLMACLQCGNKQKLPDDDKTISINYYNSGGRIITDNEIKRVLHESTTYRIKRKCPECENPYMVVISNDDYQFMFACPECESSFKPT